MTTVMSRPCCV